MEGSMKAVRLLLFLTVLMASQTALAYKWEISKESNINLSVLIQPQYQTTEDGAPSADNWSNDFFLRRARLMVFGAVNEYLTFFVDTDQINYGKNGKFGEAFFLQDAYVAYKIADEFQLAAGLILLPFTRHNFQGATGLNGLDYHSALLKFPADTTKNWRDMGLMAYGWALDQRLHYRLGVFGGSQNVVLQESDDNLLDVRSNPDDLPRVTGHLRYNFLGKETDFFAKGIYFSKEPIVSVGVGLDFVPDSIMTQAPELGSGAVFTKKTKYGSHLALAADLFAEIPFNEENEILFQGTFVSYDDGENQPGTGKGFLLEAGYRWRFLEPVVGFDSFGSDADKKDYQAIRMGLNLWGNKHGANLKGEFTMFKDGDPDQDYLKQFTLQGQFLF